MKNKFSFIDKSFVIFIICCFLSLFLFFIKDIREIKYLRVHFSNFFSIIFQPKDIFNRLAFSESINDSLMFELKTVSEINKNLSQRIRDINNYRDYDKKLDKLIHNRKFIPAKIINHSFSSSSKILTINIGSNDGVSNKNYNAVINYDGNLIGRTYFVSDKKTQVHKINDKNFHIFVTTKSNIKGQFSYVNGKYGIIESVPKKFENQLNLGDSVFTTENSRIYAENIPVAKIISIKNKPRKHELDIKVEILADLNSLKHVFVVQ